MNAAPALPIGALSVLRQPVVAWFFAGMFLTVLAHTSLYAFYSLYLASLGYGKGEIGLLCPTAPEKFGGAGGDFRDNVDDLRRVLVARLARIKTGLAAGAPNTVPAPNGPTTSLLPM